MLWQKKNARRNEIDVKLSRKTQPVLAQITKIPEKITVSIRETYNCYEIRAEVSRNVSTNLHKNVSTSPIFIFSFQKHF